MMAKDQLRAAVVGAALVSMGFILGMSARSVTAIAQQSDQVLSVKLVGIERPKGFSKWEAIPVRGPIPLSGEMSGILQECPIKVESTKKGW